MTAISRVAARQCRRNARRIVDVSIAIRQLLKKHGLPPKLRQIAFLRGGPTPSYDERETPLA